MPVGRCAFGESNETPTGIRRLFTELVRQAIEGYETSVAVPGELVEMRSMLANLGETWKKRWFAEGRAEGRVEGEAKALIRLLEKRFGPLPADMQERVLAAEAKCGWTA